MNILDEFKWANNYIQYLELRKNGLKKQAMTSMKKFIEDFKLQNKDTRREFIDYLNRLAYLNSEYALYIPHNLADEIFKKEIDQWILEDPHNSIPYKWSYDLELLKHSLELNPFDQIALSLFGEILINRIGMNQHEISSGYPYQGNQVIDLKLINYYKPFLQNIKDEQKKLDFTKQLQNLENDALNN